MIQWVCKNCRLINTDKFQPVERCFNCGMFVKNADKEYGNGHAKELDGLCHSCNISLANEDGYCDTCFPSDGSGNKG